MDTCSVSDCFAPAKKGKKGYCYKHYMRQYRNGTTDKLVVAKVFEHSGGYLLEPARGHFLARGSSHAYAHRLRYHEQYGDGPFHCHWCKTVVTWSDLNIDHLDDNKKNNVISNLVASCPPCNKNRGSHKSSVTWRKKYGIKALGKVRTLSEWSRITGLSRSAIQARISKGWHPDRTMTEPRGKQGPRPLQSTLSQ